VRDGGSEEIEWERGKKRKMKSAREIKKVGAA
jgi:hypothetical protein